jgi:twitching motility protein PilT
MPLYDDNGRIIPSGGSAVRPQGQNVIPMGRETAPEPMNHTSGVSARVASPASAPVSSPPVSAPTVPHSPAPVARVSEPAAVIPAPVVPPSAAPTPVPVCVEPAAPVNFSIGVTGPVFGAPALPIDELLAKMLAVGEGVSDLFFIVGRPPQVENFGKLMPVVGTAYSEGFQTEHVEGLARTVVGGNPRLLEDLRSTGSCDSSYSLGTTARFRVNVFRQKGSFAMVLRKLNTKIPSLEDLKLPPIFKRIIQEKTGLVFVTGATGSGKTTTLAAMLNELNLTSPMHIVTLEDPVEYLHPHKEATFCQREMGKDFSTFAMGLRAALRQAPKVILVGEIRDRETMEIALTAAETGHVVYSTLHTISAGQSINRVLGMFTKDEEKQVRERLAETLRFIVSQRLAPKVGGGRLMIPEIMGSNLRSREAIQLGENDVRNFADIIEQSRPEGWCTFEQSLVERYQEGVITEETAMLLSVNKSRMRQKLDMSNKLLGKDEATTESLKLYRTDEHLPKVITTDISSVAPTVAPLPDPAEMRLKK